MSDAASAQIIFRSNNANERTMTNKILANMTQHLALLKFLSTFSLWLIPALLGAGEPQIQVQQILQTTQSWDSVNYQNYPIGQPQLTVLRIFARSDLTRTGVNREGPM
jgi:hypothetical protein